MKFKDHLQEELQTLSDRQYKLMIRKIFLKHGWMIDSKSKMQQIFKIESPKGMEYTVNAEYQDEPSTSPSRYVPDSVFGVELLMYKGGRYHDAHSPPVATVKKSEIEKSIDRWVERKTASLMRS